jgi:hypothetical protein
MESALGPHQSYGESIPIVGLTDAQSVAVITNLCFASLWLGALGWELIMTLAFDLRLLKQTEWRSIPACIHSLAYYVSRYSTVAFIATYVAINAQTVALTGEEVCQQRITAAAAFFVISECSILLVFITRTIALWNMDRRIICILTLAWLAALGINLTLPGYGSGTVMGGFCVWQIKGGWVGASMIAMAICSLLCLVLTVGKLNSQGWRGLWRSMQPSNSRSIDAEDVSRVLVQRTTCFFFIMLLSIVVADIVYYTVDFTLWKLVAVPAYLAIAASLAGRIFRRSWKMTRSVEHSRPPSYYPGVWKNDVFQNDVDQCSSSTQPRNGRLHIYGNSHPSSSSSYPAHSKLSEEKFYFVEGQFRSPFRHMAALSVKSLALVEGETDGMPADVQFGHGFDESLLRNHLSTRRASEPAVPRRPSAMVSDDEIRPVTGDNDHIAIDMRDSTNQTPHEPLGAFGISEAPSFLPRARTRSRAVSRNGRAKTAQVATPFDEAYAWDHKRRTPRPSTAPGRESDRRQLVDVPLRSPAMQTALFASPSRPTTASSVESSSSVYATPKHNDARWSSLDVSTMPALTHAASQVFASTVRDDLVRTPTRTRLWLDSSAERARMEALAGPCSSRMSDADSIYASSNAGSSTKRSGGGSLRSKPPSSVGRRTVNGANKRLILESASRAGDNLSRQGNGTRKHVADTTSDETVADADDPLRSGYLPSPAIVPALETAGLHGDREMYDLDAMQRKLTAAPRAALLASGSSRPKTAPGNITEQPQNTVANGEAIKDNGDAEKLLEAFHRTIVEDEPSNEMDERPRTSRGTRLGSFGQHAASNEATMRRTASLNDERLRSRSSGSNADVKPFGHQSSGVSAIEQQYKRLRSLAAQSDEQDHTAAAPRPATFVGSSALVSSLTPLERIDSCSTINSTQDSHHHRSLTDR